MRGALGAFATIEVDYTITEMPEDGQVEVAFKIGAGDESAEQARQRDLHFTGLPERLFADERRAYAGRRQQAGVRPTTEL